MASPQLRSIYTRRLDNYYERVIHIRRLDNKKRLADNEDDCNISMYHNRKAMYFNSHSSFSSLVFIRLPTSEPRMQRQPRFR